MGIMLEVRLVMEQAAQRPNGLRYRRPSWGAAVNFRQNCYRFRSQQQKLARAGFTDIPGFLPSTPYDNIDVSFCLPDGTPLALNRAPEDRALPVDLLFRHIVIPRGEIMDLDGNVIPAYLPGEFDIET